MRTFKIIIFLLFLTLLVFVGHVMISTGFFRTIESTFDGNIIKKIPLKGAEDITISHIDSFAIISSTNRIVYPPIAEEDGGLFLIDLKNSNFEPIPLTNNFNTPFAPHGISIFKKDSSYQVMAINHTDIGHSIEAFELKDQLMTHIKTFRDPSMINPNDIVIIDENRFYFTNDHKYTEGLGKLAEEYLGLAISNIVYFDSGTYQEVANEIAYANGINYDKKRNLVYVASPRKFLIKVYTKQQDGSLSFIEDIPCGTGVDNIEIDPEGNLWVGSHPNLLWFNAYLQGDKEISPSEILKIVYRDTGDYSVEKIYIEDGKEMSGSTVAAPFGKLIFTGNVMDEEFLVLKQNN